MFKLPFSIFPFSLFFILPFPLLLFSSTFPPSSPYPFIPSDQHRRAHRRAPALPCFAVLAPRPAGISVSIRLRPAGASAPPHRHLKPPPLVFRASARPPTRGPLRACLEKLVWSRSEPDEDTLLWLCHCRRAPESGIFGAPEPELLCSTPFGRASRGARGGAALGAIPKGLLVCTPCYEKNRVSQTVRVDRACLLIYTVHTLFTTV
jgi:hypothetical protein